MEGLVASQRDWNVNFDSAAIRCNTVGNGEAVALNPEERCMVRDGTELEGDKVIGRESGRGRPAELETIAVLRCAIWGPIRGCAPVIVRVPSIPRAKHSVGIRCESYKTGKNNQRRILKP